MAWAMASQRSSLVQTAAFLRNAFILEKAISIGLKSGLYGGRKRSFAPVASMTWRMVTGLWAGRLSVMTMSPGISVGASTCALHKPGRPQDIGALPFSGVGGFIGPAAPVQQTPDAVLDHLHAMVLLQMGGDLAQGNVLRLFDQCDDLTAIGFQPVRAIVAALTSRLNEARLASLGHPADRRGRRNAENPCNRTARLSLSNGPDHPGSKIIGKGLDHGRWHPSPAIIMNHKSRNIGPKMTRSGWKML